MRYSTLNGILIDEAIKRLDAQLDAGAYKEIRGGKGQKLGLTDINPGYVPPVMTEIFGPFGFGWGFDVVEDGVDLVKVERNNGYIDDEWRAHCKVSAWYRLAPENDMTNTFIVKLPAIPGASANSQREWATKGAITNALGTSLFFLGWQASVYMGKRSHGTGAEVVTVGAAAFDDLSAPVKTDKPTPKAEAEPEKQVDSNKTNAGYVVKFGKHKGKALAEIGEDMIRGTLDWAQSQADPGKNIKEFIEKATAYLKSSELPFDKEESPSPAQAQSAPAEPAPATSPVPAPRPGRESGKRTKKAEPKPLVEVLKEELGAEEVPNTAKLTPFESYLKDVKTAADMKRLRTVVNSISSDYSLGELTMDETNQLYALAEERGKELKAA